MPGETRKPVHSMSHNDAIYKGQPLEAIGAWVEPVPRKAKERLGLRGEKYKRLFQRWDRE